MRQDNSIYDWSYMTKIQNQEISSKESETFFDMLDKDSELALSYEQFMSKWASINNTIVKQEINVNSAWELQKNKILEYQQSKKQNHKWMAVAASILFIMGLAYWYIPFKPAIQYYTTNTFEEKEIKLSDGTKIYLNENSTLTVFAGFNNQLRKVELQGEAFFEVAHNDNKPFIVSVDENYITVLGTSFNIKSSNKSLTEVFVASGKVSYQTPKSQHIITPGQLAITANDTTTLIKSSSTKLLNWVTHHMTFSEERLSEALIQISNAYKIPITIQGGDLSQCKITAEYNNMPISSVMETISRLFDLEIEIENNKIIVKAKSCNEIAP